MSSGRLIQAALAAILIILIIIIGLFRQQFIINLIDSTLPLFADRISAMQIRSDVINRVKIVSSGIYSIAYFTISVSLIHILFRSKKLTIISMVLFIGLNIIVVLLFVLERGFEIGSFNNVPSQSLKNFLQSPYPIMLIVATKLSAKRFSQLPTK